MHNQTLYQLPGSDALQLNPSDLGWLDVLSKTSGETKIYDGVGKELDPTSMPWMAKLKNLEKSGQINQYGRVIEELNKSRLTEYGCKKFGFVPLYSMGNSTYVRKKA